jgi:RNA-directed DNA polymerase
MGPEQRGRVVLPKTFVNLKGEERVTTAKPKPFEIPKRLVWQAYKLVKASKGAGGIDGQSLKEFDGTLSDNLYRIWNRMSSGSYFPPPVKAVAIPKKSGGERILGIPTVSDRIAQMVVKLMLEAEVEPHFHEDSYGYRPGKSAHQALEVTRKRCWWHDWVLEFDIRGLFDNIDHGLLMKAVRHHTDCKWVLLYIERWLTAPIVGTDGSVRSRDRGTPQGGVVSPLLANLFLHYAFDLWMGREFPRLPFCRYADDALVHCRSERQAHYLLTKLKSRMEECGLEIHPGKTRVVYCKDLHRRQDHENIQFDFLGYTFRPRRSKDRYGRLFVNFTPGMSREAAKAIRQTVRGWRLQLKSDKSIEDLGHMFGPEIRGWINYYCRFHKSAFGPVARHLNRALARWVMRKFKRFRGHRSRAIQWLRRLARRQPNIFPHWQAGFAP